MTASLRPYLINEAIDVVSIERIGMTAYPFNWERLFNEPDALDELDELYNWLFSCQADPEGCPLQGGESNRVCLAVESQVATAICEPHITAEPGTPEREAAEALLNRVLRVDHMVRDGVIGASELHALACKGTYAEAAEWTPLDWAERVLHLDLRA